MPQYLVTVAPHALRSAASGAQQLYLLAGGELTAEAVARICTELLHDPVTQQVAWYALDGLAAESLPAGLYAEVAYKPGVTDNEAESVIEGARRAGIGGLATVRTLRRHPIAERAEATALHNSLIQLALLFHAPASVERQAWYTQLLHTPGATLPQIERVALRGADDAELLRISQAGILALDLDEMRTVRDYFASLGRDPSDGELETIAQTWSEHCSHKTFKAKVRYRASDGGRQTVDGGRDPDLYPMLHRLEQAEGEIEIDSLIKTFLMVATEYVLEQRRAATEQVAPSTVDRPLSSDPWVLSAFVDNAGIIAFTDEYELSIKVETHNHPSALEPFGGANTGVGGVIRDLLGVSARPIANTDVLCFGMPDMPADQLGPGQLHPARTCAGVVAGVRDYGNKLGIPTVNGAVLFDPGYWANPLVFCGTVGIAPRGSHPRNVQPGDLVVLLGGRTGRDGIHGATFSSIELSHSTASEVGSAVQIGDPITEKKLLDVLLVARDARLYSAITDCGAGGLSSAVGEMGEHTGAAVQLEHVPLKYAGLQPWEIWLSEAQERMVLAVPPQNLARFLALCASEEVEASPIGSFTDDQILRVTHQGVTVVELGMAFLHGGRPQRVLEAVWGRGDQETRRPGDQETLSQAGVGLDVQVSWSPPLPFSPSGLLLALLAHPNIASKERIIRSYDHEVGGATVIKPLVGAACAGPGDAAVLQPLAHTTEGFALGCGINPRYGQHDPYWMALACVDEALRNVVAVGGDPQRTVILDNFCWGNPRLPDRMAGLVRAAAGCYDAATAFCTPFVSGKDSLNNEYRDESGARVAIPPTLLITALAHHPDITRSVTMDLKAAGNLLYLVGETRAELLGSHLETVDGGRWTMDGSSIGVPMPSDEAPSTVHRLPSVDLAAARVTFAAMHAAIIGGLVRACHDLSEGGLAVAAAEMSIAGELGLELDISEITLVGTGAMSDAGAASPGADSLIKLFSETPSRFLVEIEPQQAAAFEAQLSGVALARIGSVRAVPQLRINEGPAALIELDVVQLKQSWKGGLDEVEL